MSQPPERGIGIGAALFLTLTLVVGALAVAAAAAGLRMGIEGEAWGRAFEAVRRDPLLAALAWLGGAAAAIGAGIALGRDAERPLRDALGVRPVATAVGVLALTAGLSLALPLREIALLLTDLVPALAPDLADARAAAEAIRIEGLRDALVVPLAFVAIPAIAEELFFRGLLLPGLAARMDPRVALGLSAALFGAIHVAPIAIVYATLAGLALGWVRLKTDSVVPCVALHGAFNAVPVLLPAELVRLRGFNTVEADVYHLPLALVLGSSVVTLVCLAVIARLVEDPGDG